jgi:hypothetical protein
MKKVVKITIRRPGNGPRQYAPMRDPDLYLNVEVVVEDDKVTCLDMEPGKDRPWFLTKNEMKFARLAAGEWP